MKRINIILLIIGLAFTSNLLAKPFYIIDLITFKIGEDRISSYQNSLTLLSHKYDGKLIVNPIEVVDQIETAVTPNYTSDFEFNYTLIIRFGSKKAAKEFIRNQETERFRRVQSQYIAKQSILLCSGMVPLPGMPKFPEISNELIKGDSSFVLVNAIKMKKTPGALVKMMKYFKRNYPSITESGTSYFFTLKVNRVVAGQFDFQLLFLTQWLSMSAFEEVHDSPVFKENVHLRNSSFLKFTEGKGRVKK